LPAQIDKTIAGLEKLVNLTTSSRSPLKAHKFLQSNPQLIQDVSKLTGRNPVNLNRAQPFLDNALKEADVILKQTSKNIGNKPRFLDEYLKLKNTNPDLFKYWSANPKNNKALQSLKNMDNEKILRYINESKLSKIPLIDKARGLTFGDKMKNAGIGYSALAAASAAGIYGIYEWFDGNDPSQVASRSSAINSGLGRVGAKGSGSSVIDSVRNSMTNINGLTSKVDSGLVNNPEKASQDYIRGMGKELDSLNNALNNWDVVMEGAEDKEEAAAMKTAIVNMASEINKSLVSLGKHLGKHVPDKGVAGTGAKKNIPSFTPTINQNITKIQGVLETTFPGVKQTGELDRQTILALKQLEQSFNAKAGTSKFTGLFVAPETGYVIKFDHLIEAMDRIKKY
jgi:hypothetical protein